MEKIIEALLKLIPFAPLLEKLGIGTEASVAFAGIIILILVCALGKLCTYFVSRRKNSSAARDLAPYFTYRQVQAATRLFIPTRFQNQSPTREDEPAFSHKFVARQKLIPFFMNTALNEKKESDKFYLILADSGMGKTTFMINLYVQYNSVFNFRRKYNIRLYLFGDSRILDQIKTIKPEEARHTILLLDAFDEDKKLIPPPEPDGLSDDERFRRRLDEVIEAVRDFREVVFTSRTQYFPGHETEPYELKIPTFDEQGFHKLAKLYISPFDSKEIKRYLNKKYGVLKFWNRKKKRNATFIVNKSPKLMVRPMLLSYIDYLVGSKIVFKNTYQIYETLVSKWIDREATKRKHQTVEREKFKNDLLQYSRLVALEIYRRYKQGGSLYLKKDAAIEIACQNNIDLQDYEITGQSLLTRDVEENWKFAHKSILEFFLTKEAIDNINLWIELAKSNFAGIDMARLFYNEVGNWILVKGGKFKMGDENGNQIDDCRPVHKVTISDFYISKTPITQKQWRDVMDYNPSRFKDCDECPVENVSWENVQQYIIKLNAKIDFKFRLPTEAEWEYAARGGHLAPFEKGKGDILIGKNKYAGSDNLDEVGWYSKNSKYKTHPVATKKPNELGIYDMSGNVWEWCADWYGEKYYDECQKKGIVEHPTGPKTGSHRVLRGGCWNNNGHNCSSANRNNTIRTTVTTLASAIDIELKLEY